MLEQREKECVGHEKRELTVETCHKFVQERADEK